MWRFFVWGDHVGFRGTEECKGEDYRKVTPNQLTMERNHKIIMVELESGEARPKYSTGSNILVANERFE